MIVIISRQAHDVSLSVGTDSKQVYLWSVSQSMAVRNNHLLHLASGTEVPATWTRAIGRGR